MLPNIFKWVIDETNSGERSSPGSERTSFSDLCPPLILVNVVAQKLLIVFVRVKKKIGKEGRDR